LRLGTPAITSRGFNEPAVKRLTHLIIEVLASIRDENVKRRVADEVKELASSFPVPGLDL
jgi:glycine hydroxymethyltransferase